MPGQIFERTKHCMDPAHFRTVQVLEGSGAAIYNKIFTVPCKQFGQVKNTSVPKSARARVNEVLKHVKLCCKFIMGQKLQRRTELLNKEMSGQLTTHSYFHANACYIAISMTVKFFFSFFFGPVILKCF